MSDFAGLSELLNHALDGPSRERKNKVEFQRTCGLRDDILLGTYASVLFIMGDSMKFGGDSCPFVGPDVRSSRRQFSRYKIAPLKPSVEPLDACQSWKERSHHGNDFHIITIIVLWDLEYKGFFS